MALLLILPAWLLLLSLIAGLCCAARLGDADGRAELRSMEAEAQADVRSPAGEGQVVVADRTSARSRPARRAEIAA